MIEANQVERRRWTTVLVLGLALCCGPIFGILGTIAGMLWSFDRIETLTPPTPGDLAAGVHLSLFATMAGMIAPFTGVPLASLTKLRLQRNETELRARP